SFGVLCSLTVSTCKAPCPKARRFFLRSDARWAVSVETVEHDVEIADDGHEERIQYPDVVGDVTLDHRHDRSADDRHAQQSRAFARVPTKAGEREREDGREHDRVAEPD